MIALLQRVTQASVSIDGQTIAAIEHGLLVLLGIEKHDNVDVAERLLERVLNYRVFTDNAGKMNLSLRDIQGGLLLVPQFTLAADTRKGNRPSFTSAAPPTFAEPLFNQLIAMAQQRHSNTTAGQFGADMQVNLINDGPVTFWLQTHGDPQS